MGCCGSKQNQTNQTRQVVVNQQQPVNVRQSKVQIPGTRTCSCGWPMHKFGKRDGLNQKVVFYYMCLSKACKRQESI